jgi:predicted phage replisome organizer
MLDKKYYWLKLKEDFFDEKYIKALRKLPDGDALTIVYLKMQLKSLKTEGIIQYEHILPSAEEELALVLDEDVNTVRLTLSAILNMGLVEKWENDTLYMVAMQNLIGSETAVAERVRKHREKQKMLQCNTDVTNCNTYIEIEKRDKIKDIEYFSSEKLNEIFSEFLQMRKKIKAVNSDRAINTIINKLNKYDDDTKYKMIENSIVNSWKDVYELKQNKKIVPNWIDKKITNEEYEKIDLLAELEKE